MSSSINRRILLIDDTSSIHEDFRKILNPLPASDLDEVEAALFGEESRVDSVHFELDSAYQGQEGLAKVCEALQTDRPYAMAFVDMRMPPGWDGVQTIEQIWQQDPRIQIVICTAYSDYSWEEMLERLDVDDRLLILKKPFDNVEVHQLANALTMKWHLTRQAASKMSSLEAAVEERTCEIRRANEALQTEITERKLLESQLVQAQKMESIGQLAAGIAHEINTPAQYIGDNIRFLQDTFKDLNDLLHEYTGLLHAAQIGAISAALVEQVQAAEEAADLEYLLQEIPQAISQALEGARRVAKIVQAMKDFSHPGAQVKTAVDLNRAIESTITVAGNEWKSVAEIRTNFDPTLPPVLCLPGDFNQVILNLLINAAHAIADVVEAHPGTMGLIEVSTRLEEQWVEVRIRDTGTGIPEAVRSKVFDPFFTTKEVGKGTGQGLAIAHSIIVDKHRGCIRYETEIGQGTTFIIRLPLEAEMDGAGDDFE